MAGAVENQSGGETGTSKVPYLRSVSKGSGLVWVCER